MQDRFKFRGKRIDNNQWYYGSYLYLHNPPKYDWNGAKHESKEDVHFIIDEKDVNYGVYPETVGQCTGLKDKHGRLIFEGDIVKYFCPAEYCSDGLHKCPECYSGENGSVHYDEDLAMYEYRSKSDECPLTDNINTEEDLEIVGNIYDNPELLKEVK